MGGEGEDRENGERASEAVLGTPGERRGPEQFPSSQGRESGEDLWKLTFTIKPLLCSSPTPHYYSMIFLMNSTTI